MTISWKIKTIDNKINQNNTRYNLDKQAANVSALSPGHVGKFDFLTGKDVYHKKIYRKKLLESNNLNIYH